MEVNGSDFRDKFFFNLLKTKASATNDEFRWFRRVYVSIFSKFNVTVGRHTMMRNSCITVPAEGKKL
jgi:hypothetical protein